MRLPYLILIASLTFAPDAPAQEEFTNAVDKVEPSVASVTSTAGKEPDKQVTSVTTGVVVSADGMILTSYHPSGADSITIRLHDGKTYQGTIHGYDSLNGLEIVKIDAAGLTPAEFGNSDDLRVGQWVMTVGNQFGVEKDPLPGYSVGIVGGLNRSLPHVDVHHRDLIKTDATMNPGCVGGPLIDTRGKVVGINIAICSNNGCWQGVGYAIPSNGVQPILEKLKQGAKIESGWLGVRIQPGNPLKVIAVNSGGPAEKAGLKPGDFIVAYNGTKIIEGADLVEAITSTPPGTKAEITIRRNAKEIKLVAEIVVRPASAALTDNGGAAERPSLEKLGLDLPANIKNELSQAGRNFREAIQHCFAQINDPDVLERYRQALQQIPGIELRVISSRKIEELNAENQRLRKRVEELEGQLKK